VPLLKVMKEAAKGTGRVAPRMRAKLAPFLRRCLIAAEVTRPALFTNTKTMKHLTFYDLRATGITWLALRGDRFQVIQRRAGHTSYATTDQYVREAENLSGTSFGVPFPPLPKSLLGGKESSGESSSGSGGSGLTIQNRRINLSGGAGNRTQVRKRIALDVYVRSGPTKSPRSSPANGLSPKLVTCLLLAARPVTRRATSQTWLRPSRGADRPSSRTAFSAY
jgi:hypothetical protein